MAATEKTEVRLAARGGAVAGAIGGLVLAVLGVVMNVIGGHDIWLRMKFAAIPFIGERAREAGFAALPVLFGLLCHFAVAMGWGVLFGIFFYGWRRGATVALGALWGVVVWIGMFYVVMPLVGIGHVARDAPIGMAVLEHVIFGLSVSLAFLPYQQTKPTRTFPPIDRRSPIMP
jgi:hypothetical protein